MWWWGSTVAVLVLVAVYALWVAGRLDRSHARAAAAQAALDAHLVRRAAAAAEAAEPLGDSQLRWAARVALEADPDEREAAENDLTRVLRPVLTASHELPGGPGGAPPAVRADLARASRRVALARQVHNDLVRDALSLRRRRLVRVLRLASKHPVPRYFDIDDPQA
nr:hypothetical protein [Virgisporangium aurantiacum]